MNRNRTASMLQSMGLYLTLGCFGSVALGASSNASELETKAGDGARRVAEMKHSYSPQEIRTDDRLLREFVDAHAAATGLDTAWQRRRVDPVLARSPRLAEGLDATQLAAWRDLVGRGWDGRVTWDERRLTPSEVKPGILLRGVTGEDAQEDLEARLGALLRSMFALTDTDTRDLLEIRDAEIPLPHGNDPPLVVRRVRYARSHQGRPVFGDRYLVTLTRSAGSDHWNTWISARWTRTIEDSAPTIAPEGAVHAVRESRPEVEQTLLGSPRLGFRPEGDVARPAYEVWTDENGVRYRYFVSATSGGVLARERQSAENHDGSIQGWVRRPHEDVPSPRPMPFLNIYEDAQDYPTEPACFFNPGFDPQTRGDENQLNDTTDYAGEYENATHFDPFDLSWVVDYRGPLTVDISPYPDHTATGIPAGSDYTIPNLTTNGRNRRGEMFYLLNYGARIYDAYLIPQYEPVGFHFDALGAEGAPEGACLDDVLTTGCCSGATEDGCLWMECDMGTTGTPAAERRFREVLMHEQIHTLAFQANGGTLCSGCGGDPDTDGKECACWEEGRADFGAIAINQFEKHREDFMPGLLYPDDWGGPSLYGPGAIYTSIYIDYMLRAGLDAIGDVERNLDLIDGDTRMVGSCASATDWTTCPVNSFYRRLIASQEQWTFPRFRNSQEISAVFHDHVTDADRAVVGVQSFPWADGIANRLFNAPTMYTDLEGANVVTATSGNAGGGPIALNSADDFDNVMFLAREGETYTVETQNLAGGVDTMLEVRTIDANQSFLVGENDDCGGIGPESCLTFQAQETGFHRIIVSPHPGSLTGPAATYRFSLELEDDVGDGMAQADVFSPDDVMHASHGTFEAPGDVDVYAVVVPTEQSLGFSVCSTAETFKVNIELRNSGGGLISSKQNKKCDKDPKTADVAAGTYFLHVFASGGETGGYGLRVSLELPDIDTDDTPGNAYTVTPDVGVGTLFENAFEEDWFRIDAVAGRTYVVESIGVDGGVDPTLEVYAPANTMYAPPQLPDTSGHGLGHWMMRNDEGGLRGADARTLFWAPVSGTYLVRVRPDGGSAAGRYHLVVHDNSGFTNDYPAFP